MLSTLHTTIHTHNAILVHHLSTSHLSETHPENPPPEYAQACSFFAPAGMSVAPTLVMYGDDEGHSVTNCWRYKTSEETKGEETKGEDDWA